MRTEDLPCLETNLMLKQAIHSADLWVYLCAGHVFNLVEPAAFVAEVPVSGARRLTRNIAIVSYETPAWTASLCNNFVKLNYVKYNSRTIAFSLRRN
jgi:hypothetical protein